MSSSHPISFDKGSPKVETPPTPQQPRSSSSTEQDPYASIPAPTASLSSPTLQPGAIPAVPHASSSIDTPLSQPHLSSELSESIQEILGLPIMQGERRKDFGHWDAGKTPSFKTQQHVCTLMKKVFGIDVNPENVTSCNPGYSEMAVLVIQSKELSKILGFEGSESICIKFPKHPDDMSPNSTQTQESMRQRLEYEYTCMDGAEKHGIAPPVKAMRGEDNTIKALITPFIQENIFDTQGLFSPSDEDKPAEQRKKDQETWHSTVANKLETVRESTELLTSIMQTAANMHTCKDLENFLLKSGHCDPKPYVIDTYKFVQSTLNTTMETYQKLEELLELYKNYPQTACDLLKVLETQPEVLKELSSSYKARPDALIDILKICQTNPNGAEKLLETYRGRQGHLKKLNDFCQQIDSILNGYGSAVLAPCHGSLHPLNMVIDSKDEKQRVLFIDFEKTILADPMADLAYFANMSDIGIKDMDECFNVYFQKINQQDPATRQKDIERFYLYLTLYDIQRFCDFLRWHPTKEESPQYPWKRVCLDLEKLPNLLPSTRF